MTVHEFLVQYDQLPLKLWLARFDEGGKIRLKAPDEREFQYVPLTAVCMVKIYLGYPPDSYKLAGIQLGLSFPDSELIGQCSERRVITDEIISYKEEIRERLFRAFNLR